MTPSDLPSPPLAPREAAAALQAVLGQVWAECTALPPHVLRWHPASGEWCILEVLGHLRRKGSLDPFWLGKFSIEHLPIMQELAARGLLRPPPVRPAFLSHPAAGRCLEAARAGISPLEMVAA